MISHSYKRGHKIFWCLDTDGSPCSHKWVMPVWVSFIKDNLSYSGINKFNKDTVKEQLKLHPLLLMKIHNCCCFFIQLPHWHCPFITKSKSYLFLSWKTALRFNLYFTCCHLPIDPKIGFSLTLLKIFEATYYVMYYTIYKTPVLHLTERPCKLLEVLFIQH